MQKRLLEVFWQWLPFAVAIVLLCALIYFVGQWSYRAHLNDPQIQMTKEAAAGLLKGKLPIEIVPRGVPMIDADNNLEPFLVIFDKNGNSLESSAVVNNQPPAPPIGVFEYAEKYGENRLTWQPNGVTRIALVVRAVGNNAGWFVAAGRNMREVENQEGALRNMTFAALFAGLAGSYAFYYIKDERRRRIN